MNKLREHVFLSRSFITRCFTWVQIKLHQKKYKGLPFLYQKGGSNALIIIFSAFTGKKRRFNYIKSFKDLKCDKLYILDPWGYLGSYYLYENGQNYPMLITEQLIRKVIRRGGYTQVYTAGTSKGGTSAIYFGLTIGSDEIFSGACQYNLGTYLWRKEFRDIFYGMMGKNAGQLEVAILDDIIKAKVRENSRSHSRVHVIYSKQELTYERQIIDLLHDLKSNYIPFIEVESFFEKHEYVAEPFVKYVINFLENL